ncbi:hypothetical protein FA15DRAFT_694246 [Coprinopsis marcescibilis]|uniref:Uncharacterized protein n=1 Tax=Coprinopsis marcescibilis TaxID=230819 RepID=A0A5C3KVK1_COPMA|nr:hypothetical protein FA15DRAFT_694246 [Coprinopsis marcescibilis]
MKLCISPILFLVGITSTASGSNDQPVLEVQIDLDRAQTTESDIEILNGFWADIYKYLGISVRDSFSASWYPPYSPYGSFLNVQQTPGPELLRKENAFTASYPNSMQGLPWQASAVWRYDPSSRKLTPTFLAVNGTRLPAEVYGGIYEGNCYFNIYGTGVPPGGQSETVEFYFLPAV